MDVREAIDELNDVLCRKPVPQDEVLTVIATTLKSARSTGLAVNSARMTGDREVVYFAPDERPAIRLSYTHKGNITARADTGLDEELASLVMTRVRSLISAGVPVLWRQVWFSSLPLLGYWRYRNEWQMVPVPDDAPKPEFLMAENPFLIEVRGVVTGDYHIDHDRAQRRLWELRLILSLVLRVSISNGDRSPTHAWVEGDGRPEYRQRRYFIPNPTAPANDFTPVLGLDPVPTVIDDEYFDPWTRSSGFQVDVPALLPSLLDRYAAATLADKDTFLRACYWRSRASEATARLSISLAYVSVINSIEVLVTDAEKDPCPECGRDRAPGLTARFRELVERYAPGTEGASHLYTLRSKLVHGGVLLDLDLPAAWGSLDPDKVEQSHQYELARRVATAVIIGWFFDQTES